VLNVDNWGKRKLAYEIKKELKGIYLFWQYLASSQVVTEFERNMRMLDPVIRYMTVLTARDIDPASRPSQVSDETYQKASSTAADEEELMLRRTDEAAGEGDEFATGDDDSEEFAVEPVVAEVAEVAAEVAEVPKTEETEAEEPAKPKDEE
jgi:small subunit ribosomal protein S6